MFGGKRYYSGKGRRFYYYGRRYGRYYGRGTVGRAASGAIAAKKSNKVETYSCTVNGCAAFTLEPNSNLSDVRCFHPFCGGIASTGIINDVGNLAYGGAVNDRGFRMKCASYDEVKLDSMKVTLTPAQVLVNNNITLTMMTIWDRKANPKEVGYIGAGTDWMANGSVPTPLDILNNEGVIKTQVTGNNIYGMRRYCAARPTVPLP